MRRLVSQIIVYALMIALTLASSVVVTITTVSYLRSISIARTGNLVVVGDPMVGLRGATNEFYPVVTLRIFNLGDSGITMNNIRAYILFVGTNGSLVYICNTGASLTVPQRSVVNAVLQCNAPINFTTVRSIFGGVISVDRLVRSARFLTLVFTIPQPPGGGGGGGDGGGGEDNSCSIIGGVPVCVA